MIRNKSGFSTRTSSSMLRILIQHMSNLGLPDAGTYLKGKVSDEVLADIDGLVPETIYDDFLNECAELSQDPFFGLHLGKHLHLQKAGVLGFLLMNADTWGNCFRAFVKFQSTFNEAVKLEIQERGKSIRVQFHLLGGQKSGRHMIESYYSAIRTHFHHLTDHKLVYQKVGLAFSLGKNSSEYEKILGIIPESTSENYLEFSADYFALPILNSDPNLIQFFEKTLHEKMSSSESLSLLRKVKQELIKRLSNGSPRTILEISKQFGMSERNLQAKLEQEGTTFREVHDQVQADFATRFLGSGSPTSEVAYLLGFAEVAAFQRAYKRWTGITPGEARKANKSQTKLLQ